MSQMADVIPVPKPCPRARETKRQWEWYRNHEQSRLGCEFGWLVTRAYNEFLCLNGGYDTPKRGILTKNVVLARDVHQTYPDQLKMLKAWTTFKVYRTLHRFLDEHLGEESEITKSEVIKLAVDFHDKARQLLAARPGKPFRTVIGWDIDPDDYNLIITHKQKGKLDLHACRRMWVRGKVYQQWADDLTELASRWDYHNYRTEFDKRIYTSQGRLMQPEVPVRNRTVVKIEAKRRYDQPRFEGGFLDT